MFTGSTSLTIWTQEGCNLFFLLCMVEFVIALYCLCSCERSLHWWRMKFEGGLKNIIKLTGAYKTFSSSLRVKYSGRTHNCLLDKSWLIFIVSVLDRNFNWLSSSEMNGRTGVCWTYYRIYLSFVDVHSSLLPCTFSKNNSKTIVFS